MTPEEVEQKYLRLVDRVRRMRGYQREWDKFHCSSDKEYKRRLEREVDELIIEEVKKQKSKQQEIFK
jgi:hypothetical protein